MSSVDSISRVPVGERAVNFSGIEKNSSQIKESNIKERHQEKIINHNVKQVDLEEAINDFNRILDQSHTSLKYIYHDKLKQYYVTLVNEQTQETVREIPPKKLLDMYASMREYLGLFVDNKI